MSKVPENLFYTKEHEWVLLEKDGKVRIGITHYAQESLSDVVFVELPEIGTDYSKGDVMAVAESVKAASDIYAPVSGKVIEINNKLEESPELINESPYDFGWLVLIDPERDVEGLWNSQTYRDSIA